MVLVIGYVVTRADTVDEALSHSLAHVARSRLEPGCLSHEVSRDAYDPLRLVFVERWADRSALLQHFAVPASRSFAKALAQLAAAPPTIDIYQADPVKLLP